jgi:hypothetical protein
MELKSEGIKKGKIEEGEVLKVYYALPSADKFILIPSLYSLLYKHD